jgi:hypothetical protein
MDRSDECLWIIDKQARVQRIDARTGRALGEWQMPEWEMGKPTGITVWNPTPTEGDEIIFVPDTHYFRVMVYRASDAKPGIHSIPVSSGTTEAGSESNGAVSPPPLAKFGSYGNGPGQFIYLTDVALLPSSDGKRVERVYVSEYGGNDRISIYQPPPDVSQPGEYTFVSSFGTFGSANSPVGSEGTVIQFNRPQSMVIDVKRQELYVTDSCNHRLGRFTLDGKLLGWVSSPEEVGQAAGAFNYPYGITLLDDGSVLVAEFGNSRVQRVEMQTGRSLGIFGERGRGAGQLATPWAVTMVRGEAYVLDSGNNRVQVFEVPGV